MSVPSLRIRARNQAPERPGGAYVLYWMIAARRTRWNFGLEHAVERAKALGKPLLVLEALRAAYPHASDRFHRFVVEGMEDNARAFAKAGVAYHPYVEPRPGDGKLLLETLAAKACLVVTDEFPTFFLPRMVAAVAPRLPVRLDQVDSLGLLPLRASEQAFATAYAFRRFLQKNLRPHLDAFPKADPLGRLRLPPLREVPRDVATRWPAAFALGGKGAAGEGAAGERSGGEGAQGKGAGARTTVGRRAARGATDAAIDCAEYPIDHSIGPAPVRGGPEAGTRTLAAFVAGRLARYGEDRNHPDLAATSGLSPWLHFGHVSAHAVVHAVLDHEGWSLDALSPKADGSREGWWGVSPGAEGFLDQVVTWRELGHQAAAHRPDVRDFEALPAWARRSLREHAKDLRPLVYDRAALEQGATHDRVWNAAQRELRESGRIHNYLRMLWGKKVLEWSPSPEEALATLIHLNDRYALDGRDPNSYAGITWCLGQYDRPWAPERPIFGVVRYMSSDNTMRKIRLKGYLRRWSGEGELFPDGTA